MRKELKNIAEYRKPSNDAFASVARSFGEPTIVLRRLPSSQLAARLRFSLSSSPKHMTPTFPRYRSSEECSSSGSLLGHSQCRMPISTKKKPWIVSNARRLKPKSMPSPRGDEPPPRVCPPNERQEPSRRVSPAPMDRARPRGRPVQSVAESVSLFRRVSILHERIQLCVSRRLRLFMNRFPQNFTAVQSELWRV